MSVSPLRRASGFVPVTMSLAALALVLGHYALSGIVHEADEGTGAGLAALAAVFFLT